MSATAVGWRRVTARSILVGSVPRVASIWLTAALISDGAPFAGELVGEYAYRVAAVVAAAAVLDQILRWLTTWYAVEERTVRLRTGWLIRRRTTVDRRRIRSVVLRSGVLGRPLGVTRATLGTAEGGVDVSVDLAWIPTPTARRLRTRLLDHATPGTAAPGVLARGSTSWALWAPFSALSVSLWAGSYVVAYQLFAAYFAWLDTVQWLVADRDNLATALRALVVIPVLVGVVGSILVYLEFWWGFTLRRMVRGTLETRYGLVVRRSASLQESRLRGVEFVQPLLPRMVRRGRLMAVTTGSGSQSTLIRNLPLGRRRTLLPLGPAVAAARTAAAVLDRDVGLARLVGHPVQARYKRYRWAAAITGLGLLAVWLLFSEPLRERLTTFGVAGLVLLALALLVADDNYRSLGHRLDPDLLLIRSGTVRRTTTVMQRRAVVGWVFRQSWFQYRLGLVTAIASTAAGQGSYTLYDAGCVEAVAFAGDVTPEVLEHRLDDHVDSRGTGPKVSNAPGVRSGPPR